MLIFHGVRYWLKQLLISTRIFTFSARFYGRKCFAFPVMRIDFVILPQASDLNTPQLRGMEDCGNHVGHYTGLRAAARDSSQQPPVKHGIVHDLNARTRRNFLDKHRGHVVTLSCLKKTTKPLCARLSPFCAWQIAAGFERPAKFKRPCELHCQLERHCLIVWREIRHAPKMLPSEMGKRVASVALAGVRFDDGVFLPCPGGRTGDE
jgi:hypothetical protein